jgi:hypothetical protein
MADLSGLKKRVELIDLRLRTAHGARERESAALMEMWEQIRIRFLDQNAEITSLRDRVSDLEDTRDELLQMVHGLLSAVEGGLERMSDETVPQIKLLAGELLKSAGEALPTGRFAGEAESAERYGQRESAAWQGRSDEAAEEVNFHSDLLSAIEQSLEDANENAPPEMSDESARTEVDSRRRRVGEPASPGIRNLIARIEGAVGADLLEMSLASAEGEDLDDELTRDLREIEALRGELHGLRERISNGSR